MSHNLQDGPQPLGPRPDAARPAPTSPADARPLSHPGQAYTPPPSSQHHEPASVPPKVPLRVVGFGVLAAAGIMAGGWFVLAGRGTPPATPVAAVEQAQKTFAVAAVDADAKATDQLKAMLAGGAAPDRDDLHAINSAGLVALAKNSPTIAADIQSGRRVLYRLYLLDFLAEDGDHVELFVDGASFGDTVLKGAGTSFLIPLAPGSPAQLKLLATADGGGGVTVGFLSSLNEARTRVMQVGDFDQWQVMIQ